MSEPFSATSKVAGAFMSAWVGLTALSALSTVLALIFWYSVFENAYRGYTAATWPAAEGVIVKSEAIKSRYTRRRKVPEIAYTYTVGGNTFHSDRIIFGGTIENPFLSEIYGEGQGRPNLFMDPVETNNLYPVGKKVDVLYQPSNPAVACLSPGVHPTIGFTVLWSVVFSFFAFFWLFAVKYLEKMVQRSIDQPVSPVP